MPRHDSGALDSVGHFHVPYGERRPVFLTPDPTWVVNSYRVKRWYYRAAPAIGDRVMYLEDGFGTRVQSVKFFSIFFEDGSAMRRPYVGRRLVACLLPRLQNLIPTRASSSRKRGTGRVTLRPDASTLWV